MVNKLVECISAEKYTENIDEARLVELTSAKNESKHKCSFCTLFIVLFAIFSTANVGVDSYFLCFTGTW